LLVSEGKTLVAQNWCDLEGFFSKPDVDIMMWKIVKVVSILTGLDNSVSLVYTDHNQKHDLQKVCLLHHFNLPPLDLPVVSNG
jgi:hypothetical protein